VCVCTIEQASIFKIISNMYYIHNPTYHPKAPLTRPGPFGTTAHALTLTPKIKFSKHTIFKTIPIRNGMK